MCVAYYLMFGDVFFSVFFFKQKTAYELRISDWSSDVCSSDLWHNGGEIGGWWTAYLNNRIEADHPVTGDAWPADAVAVMANAGIEPGAGDISYRRSEERRGGQVCFSTCRSRLSPCP